MKKVILFIKTRRDGPVMSLIDICLLAWGYQFELLSIYEVNQRKGEQIFCKG